MEALGEDRFLWDSGKVKSDETQDILCPLEIKSRQRIYWTVRAWNEEDEDGSFSNPVWFETGLKDSSDWSAEWINPESVINPAERQPVSYLRRRFMLEKKVKKSRLYMTSCGMYCCLLNGKPVDNQLLTPGTTQYDKRLQVQTYDVTNLLREGENVLAVTLGDGWFRGMNGMQRNRDVYGEYIALLGQLEMTFVDNEKMQIVTDKLWKATQNGPIRFSDYMQGEIYDANMELDGWKEAGYDDSSWHDVTIINQGYHTLIGSNGVAVLERETLGAKILYRNEQELVLDFGQNISGYVSLIIPSRLMEKGESITLEHGEALDASGQFTMENLESSFDSRTPHLLQKVTYIVSKKQNVIYKPLFSTFGFRYVKVTGCTEGLGAEHFIAHAVYSEVERTAFFRCSSSLLNQLVENTVWSQKSNFVDVPTDCPQRERAGYTGDAQVFVKTGSLLIDSFSFYRKWLADLRATQLENGMLSNIAPMQQKEMAYFDGSAGWGDAIVIVPYMLYRQYGSRKILEENYSAMKSWVEFEFSEAQKAHPLNRLRWRKHKRYIWDTGRHWGEWLEPGQTMKYLLQRMYLGCPETATAYMYYSSRLLGEIGEILGHTQDAALYKTQAKKIRQAYREIFLPKAFHSKRQCLSVRPIFMGLANQEETKKLAKHLNQLVVENGYHLNTGFLSTPYICQVLADNGYTKTAWKLMEQEEMPGWLYPIKKGATTIWEKWDGVKEDGSLDSSQNHYSYGAIVGWLFEEAAGIRPKKAGYKQFVIAPRPGGSLKHVEARMMSVHGEIFSGWKIQGQQCMLSIQVPANTLAEIYLPVNRQEQLLKKPSNVHLSKGEKGLYCQVGSGNYEFCIDLKP